MNVDFLCHIVRGLIGILRRNLEAKDVETFD